MPRSWNGYRQRLEILYFNIAQLTAVFRQWQFSAISTSASSKEELTQWLQEFEDKTSTRWGVRPLIYI